MLAVLLGGSVPPIATVPPTWAMHYGPAIAGVEYMTVSALSGAYPSARLVTASELSSRLLGRSPSRPLKGPVLPGVSLSPWHQEISARRMSCPR